MESQRFFLVDQDHPDAFDGQRGVVWLERSSRESADRTVEAFRGLVNLAIVELD